VRFAVRAALAGAHDLLVFPFNPYPGSALYRRLVAEGRIDPEAPEHPRFLLHADYGDTGAVRSWSVHLSARQVLLVSLLTMALFYGVQMLRRPRRLGQMIVRLAQGRPVTWIERMLFGHARRRRYRRATRTPWRRRGGRDEVGRPIADGLDAMRQGIEGTRVADS